MKAIQPTVAKALELSDALTRELILTPVEQLLAPP